MAPTPPGARSIARALTAAVFFAFAMGAVLAPRPASSITIQVPGDESTIAAALQGAVAGDSIVVSCGTYFEHNLVLKSGVVLRSASGLPDCVTIDAQDDGRVMYADSVQASTRVEGITFKDGANLSGMFFSENNPIPASEDEPEDEGAAFVLQGDDYAPWLAPLLDGKHEPSLRIVDRIEIQQGEGIQFSLSALAWDPFANTAAPVSGTRKVYLWLVCSQPGTSAFEAHVSGTLAPLGFIPEGGVLNVGTAEHLLLAIPNCPKGFTLGVRLGYWILPGEAGTFCLAPTSGDDLLASVNCTVNPTLFLDPAVTGFVSGSGTPCHVGTRWCVPNAEIRDVGGGAGLYAIDSSPTFERCIFKSNESRAHGGAVRARRSSLHFVDCTFQDNRSVGHGGGCAFELGGENTIQGCSFLDNRGRTGAGVYSSVGFVSVEGSTFLRNVALVPTFAGRGSGGAIAVAYSEFHLDRCTLALNSGGSRGGGIYATVGSSVFVAQSIIAFSAHGSAIACDGGGTADLSCTDLFGNAGGDYVNCVQNEMGQDGNLQLNPLFCDLGAGNVHLADLSACLPENNSCGLLIGAEDAGCVEPAVFVTVTTVPSGLQIIVDGQTLTAPQSFPWELGSVHSIGTVSPQQETSTQRYDFASWNDGGAIIHDVTISEASPATFTAQFTRMYFVSMNHDPGGSVTPASGWYAQGSAVPIHAAADPEYFFSGWTGTGSGSYTGPLADATITVNSAIGETAHFTSSSFMLTMVAGPNGTVTPPSGPQGTGTQVQIQAFPNPGYVFTGWTGSGPGSYTGMNNPATVTMNGNITQTATFALPNYFLSMSVTPAGSGTVSPTSQFISGGTVVTITATPNPGYVFLHWTGSGNGSYSGTNNPATITMNGSITETAVFGFAQPQCNVTMVSGANGSTVPPAGVHVYNTGTNLQIQATPQPGYLFSSWSGSGINSYSGTQNPVTIFLLGDITQTANFVQSYPLTMVAGQGGTVTPPSGNFPAGSQVTIRAFPSTGYTFQQWTGQGAGSYTGTANPVNITMLGPITQTATFSPIIYQLTMTATIGGTVTPPSGPYPYGSQVQITATPSAGSTFIGWTGSGPGSYTGPALQTTITILGNVSEHAVFAAAVPVTIDTNPTNHPVQVDGISYVSPQTFTWAQGTDHTVEADSVFAIDSGSRWSFASWSDGLARFHHIQTPPTGTLITASYTLQYLLTMVPTPEGTTVPGTGWHNTGTSLLVLAVPNANYAFDYWEGSGAGSYSGDVNPAPIVMNGPVQEHAFFHNFGYNFSISASDTQPFVNTAPPAGGIRNLYLWMTCGEEGIAAFQGSTTGSLVPLSFIPSPGIYNAGDADDLLLAIGGCPTGESINLLLGSWLVIDQGGDLCFALSEGADLFAAVDCDSIVPTLSLDPRVLGFASAGTPCVLDVNPCLNTPPAPQAAPMAPLAEAASRTTALQSIGPNPFSGKTEIHFSLAQAGKARILIYDIAGRLVHRLVDQDLQAGNHRITWEGRDGQGVFLPAGVYFTRFEAGGVQEIRKIVYLGLP
jgi:uncharacterized repeat protein (TIGR02543 family)